MSALERLLAAVLLLIALLVSVALSVHHYSAARYDAGYAAAVAAGKEARDAAATSALAIESGLRASLLDKDTAALRKEQEYVQNLDAAQRRVRVGTDRLRCPAASAVQPASPTATGPDTAVITVNAGGPDLVPEAAADVLGYGAAIAGLVRRYDRVTALYEQCRQINNH